MILRGAFWMGLVWLCMSHGPDLGFGPSTVACNNAACADPVAQTSETWRAAALTRLAAIKIELNEATARRRGWIDIGRAPSPGQ